MAQRSNAFWIGVLALLLVAAVCIVKFNHLSTYDEEVSRAWKPLESQLQIRYDQVPKLVNEVILYTGGEDEHTRSLAQAQKAFTGADRMLDQIKTANTLEVELERLFLQAHQRYPGINGHFQYQQLSQGFQTTMQGMEGPMNAFNDAVEKYNMYARKFPNDLIAMATGFGHHIPYFKKEQD